MGQKPSTFNFDDEKKQDLITKLSDASKGKFKWRIEDKYDFIEANRDNYPLFWRRYILPIGDEEVRGSPIILDLTNPIDKAINYYYGITGEKNVSKASKMFEELSKKGNKTQKGLAFYYLGRMVKTRKEKLKRELYKKSHLLGCDLGTCEYALKMVRYMRNKKSSINKQLLEELRKKLGRTPTKKEVKYEAIRFAVTLLDEVINRNTSSSMALLYKTYWMDWNDKKPLLLRSASLGNSKAMFLVDDSEKFAKLSASLGSTLGMDSLLDFDDTNTFEIALQIAVLDNNLDVLSAEFENKSDERYNPELAKLIENGDLKLFLINAKKGLRDRLLLEESRIKLDYCYSMLNARIRFNRMK